MSVQSTLLRPTPKIANYSSYWVCVSARRGFSASPPGVRPASPLIRLEGIIIKKKKKEKKKEKLKKGTSRTREFPPETLRISTQRSPQAGRRPTTTTASITVRYS